MKQTAVEWLWDISQEREIDAFDFEQAKAMEKEHIANAYVYGSAYGIDMNNGLNPTNYYKETYESNT